MDNEQNGINRSQMDRLISEIRQLNEHIFHIKIISMSISVIVLSVATFMLLCHIENRITQTHTNNLKQKDSYP